MRLLLRAFLAALLASHLLLAASGDPTTKQASPQRIDLHHHFLSPFYAAYLRTHGVHDLRAKLKDVCLNLSWEGLRSALNDDEKISHFMDICIMQPRSHGSLRVLQVATGLICHRTGQQSPHWLTWMPRAFLLPSCRSPSQAWTLGSCRKLPGRRERCCPHPHAWPCPCDSHFVKMTAVLRKELRHHTCRGRWCLRNAHHL